MVDLICLAVMAISVFLGALRGLVYAVLSIVGWALAVVCARWVGPDVAQFLPGFSPSAAGGTLGVIAGYVVVFVVVAFLSGWVASQMGKLTKSSGFGTTDRMLGAVFGGIRAIIILLGVVVLVEMTPVAQSEEWRSSAVTQVLSQVGQSFKILFAQPPEKVS